jgi:hypothetical protein
MAPLAEAVVHIRGFSDRVFCMTRSAESAKKRAANA